MYCGFNEEQNMWRKTVNDFMDKEVGGSIAGKSIRKGNTRMNSMTRL